MQTHMPSLYRPWWWIAMLGWAMCATLGVSMDAAARERPPAIAGGVAPNYRAIVQLAVPAVVGVNVAGMHSVAPSEWAQVTEDDPVFRLFRGLPGFRDGPGGSVPFWGQGSGFILTPDGLVLTSAHVVSGAEQVTVKLSDRREFIARVLGSDPVTDVAVLKIDMRGLPVVQLGDVSQLQVGDPVLTIGAPFGLEQSATHGIVSALGRSLPGESLVSFIQTDAAVNPGNSGGPLLDASGSVVGINAQIYSNSGGYQGLSFAIPIDTALRVKDQIVANGYALHARLGVTVQDVNQALAESFGLRRPNGAVVANVAPDSAADEAGLRLGDVITAWNGSPVFGAGDIRRFVARASPGVAVQLAIWRDRAPRALVVTLGNAQDAPTRKPPIRLESRPNRLGLVLRSLAPLEQSMAQLASGLLVLRVDGLAARAGVRPGDVLLAVNGQTVSSVDQVRAISEQNTGTLALLFDRDGERLYIPILLK